MGRNGGRASLGGRKEVLTTLIFSPSSKLAYVCMFVHLCPFCEYMHTNIYIYILLF